MTDAERSKFRLAGLLAPSRVSIGRWELRPLSVASLVLADRIGMDLTLRRDVPETLSRYLWAHSAPIAEVQWAVFADHWRELVEEMDLSRYGDEEADLVAYLSRSLRAAEATWVQMERRKGPGDGGGSRQDLPPVDLVMPDLRAVILSGAARALPGMTEEHLMWEMPLARTLGYYHVIQAQREDVWTVAPRAPDATATGRGMAALVALREAAGMAEDGEGDEAGGAESLLPDWLRSLTPPQERGDGDGLDV